MIEENRGNLYSEIVNNKKQIIFKVDQTSDYVFPNELYKYQIYCKNVSGETIEDVHIKVINPATVAINEGSLIPPEGVEIGDLNNGQSHLLYLPSRCSETGEFVVHFICYGKESGLFVKTLKIKCNYNVQSDKTIHKIHIYNFTPYEDTYELHSKDYNSDVTQLIKKQKLPYGARKGPFHIEESNLEQNKIVDESQSYLDQKEVLYGDKYNTDEHTYQYLERENFNEDSVESFEGENLIDIFNQINEHSKFFKAKFLKVGTNYLYNDFREYNPDGFIYRFGLMNSEIFHHLGVLPEYTYMNDYLFRWASEGKLPLNLYPKRIDMNWNLNRWAGHGYNVYKTYTEEYKNQIINSKDYKPLFEYVQTFEDLQTAKQYINNEYSFDTTNRYYIENEEGIQLIKKYQYIIKESYFDTGVFFVDIPLKKIPTNFLLLDIDELEAIIEKTKPYGMKALIRYIIETKFNINFSFKVYPKVYPKVPILLEDFNDISYSIIPYQYDRVIEEICYIENNTRHTKTNSVIKKVPKGVAYSNSAKLNIFPEFNFKKPDVTEKEGVELNTEFVNNGYECDIENSLTKFSEIQDLLYQGNFEDISFYIEDRVKTQEIGRVDKTDTQIHYVINKTNYQLWIESLYDSNGNKNVNPHSRWWDISLEDSQYKIANKDINFVEIPLTSVDFRKNGVESGIGFEDLSGQLHGISAEKDNSSEEFIIKYTTSKNKNFKIKKQGISDLVGLAFKFLHIKNNTLIVLFIKKEEEGKIRYYYFNHIIVNKISSIFCFTRNDKEITSVMKWSDLIRFSPYQNDPKIIFNTPQYDNLNTYDPNIIITDENSIWQNINRIDRNEYSYSIAQNLTDSEISTNSINLHFDNIDIPSDSIIKYIGLKIIGESNSYKSIYPMFRVQDGFITENSISNNIIVYPATIECFPLGNHDTDYYQKQLDNANKNNIKASVEFYEKKIIENQIFDDSLELSLDFLESPNDYITISKPHWILLSDFSDYDISMNEISNIKLYIEGYNKGKEVYLSAQLKQDDLLSEKNNILIPSGYFKKQIPLSFYNKFNLNNIQTKFRFRDLNNDLQLFDCYIDVEFKEKQNEKKEFIEKPSIDIEKKQIVKIPLEENLPAYILNNGFTAQLNFDDLEIGEYYRIYSIELNIIYRKQNIDFLVNSNIYQDQNEFEKRIIAVGGQRNDGYLGGMFFDEVIMPGAYQPDSTPNIQNQGIELEDALYQSFIATRDNITSITIYPNGFIGNPDVNLKIALYENKGNTPNRLIKQIRVSGWSKANDKLKNLSVISYDFNVNNLKIGEKYWFKIEVDTVSENNYYLLKYIENSKQNMKLLIRKNNNFINTFGCLKFHVNTLDTYRSFNSIPISEDKDFINPKAFISINKGFGELKNIRFLKSGQIES